MAKLEILPKHLPAGGEAYTENLGRNSRCPGEIQTGLSPNITQNY
jgi:hypothetical protein